MLLNDGISELLINHLKDPNSMLKYIDRLDKINKLAGRDYNTL